MPPPVPAPDPRGHSLFVVTGANGSRVLASEEELILRRSR